ncbi:hypothetical protein [Hyalangium versicolor]|uniref:hypothetical protein n=1 Tax=Hyalangium versicolor TaxID=2861190 RepID=UPI001CC98450|nr:hypothetical protein [Hyalangium versicolor]
MRRLVPNPRGMALVMAMIVVVLITLLVAGAISFTGTELAASEVQTREDEMSACVQAARNLFLSKLKAAEPGQVKGIQFGQDLRIKVDPNEPPKGGLLKTGHIGAPAQVSAQLAAALDNKMARAQDIGMVTGDPSVPEFYTVTAVCREDATDLTSPEREIEFMIRVGL